MTGITNAGFTFIADLLRGELRREHEQRDDEFRQQLGAAKTRAAEAEAEKQRLASEREGLCA